MPIFTVLLKHPFCLFFVCPFCLYFTPFTYFNFLLSFIFLLFPFKLYCISSVFSSCFPIQMKHWPILTPHTQAAFTILQHLHNYIKENCSQAFLQQRNSTTFRRRFGSEFVFNLLLESASRCKCFCKIICLVFGSLMKANRLALDYCMKTVQCYLNSQGTTVLF
jgi:hypothetical protein